MLLPRYLAHAALIPALLAGCNQSLFDSGGGGDGPGDGGSRTDVPDARSGAPDAGTLPPDATPDAPGAPDGGRPDARLQESCPPPCAGDAFAEFGDQQGGPDGWRYIEVQSDGSFVDMTPASFPDAAGWQGTGPSAPTIARCNATSVAPPCLQLDRLVALTSNAQATSRPALIWTPSEYGTFIVSGSLQVPSLASGTEITMKLTRNGEAEQLYLERVTLATAPHAFEFEVDVTQGDDIVLSASPTTEASVSVGVNLFFSGPY